jgi:hypothetical protein
MRLLEGTLYHSKACQLPSQGPCCHQLRKLLAHQLSCTLEIENGEATITASYTHRYAAVTGSPTLGPDLDG